MTAVNAALIGHPYLLAAFPASASRAFQFIELHEILGVIVIFETRIMVTRLPFNRPKMITLLHYTSL